MASVDFQSDRRSGPALATTYEGSGESLLERMAPLVEVLEIPPDSIARSNRKDADLRPEILDEIAAVSPPLKLIVHGVGLSIGSFDGWNECYLKLLDQFFDRFTPQWHSEHLAYTTVAGENVGTMLALPRTEEVLDLTCERIRRLQERYAVPFLIEHVINLLPDAPADYSAAEFLNAITSRTGCGLILDAYNLECDRHNFGFDVAGFLDALNLGPVRELHVAGGTEHNGFRLDIHSRPTAEPTLALAREIIARAPNLGVVTYEFLQEAIPALGHDGISAELRRVRKALWQ